MFRIAKGLVTPRCTPAGLLLLLFASMVIGGCARKGGDPASESASAAAPTANAGDQATAQDTVADRTTAETIPVLRDGRWFAPGQHPDSQHPYGFFEKEAKSPCILVTPRGTVWLKENTPVNQWLASDSKQKLINGWIVSPENFVSLSNETFAYTIEHANQHDVEFVLSPVADDSPDPTVASVFGLDGGRRYFKLDVRPSAFQRDVGVKREVAEKPLKPGCAAALGEEVIAYQFELATKLGGDYRELLAKVSPPIAAIDPEAVGHDQGATGTETVGTWEVFLKSSKVVAAAALSGSEVAFYAQNYSTKVSQTRSALTVWCHRRANEPWRLSVTATKFDGDIKMSLDERDPVTYTLRLRSEENGSVPELDAADVPQFLSALVSARRASIAGADVFRENSIFASFDLTGTEQLMARYIANCPAAGVAALVERSATVADASGQVSIPVQFHGTWARDLKGCEAAEEIGSPPDPGAIIDAAGVSRYEYYCKPMGIRVKTSDTLVADVECTSEEATSNASLTLIRVADRLRIDGAGDYVACKTPSRRLNQTQTQGATPDAIPLERLGFCAAVAGQAFALGRSDTSNSPFAQSTIELATATGMAYVRYRDDHAMDSRGLGDERLAAIKRQVSTMAVEPVLKGLMDCAKEARIQPYLIGVTGRTGVAPAAPEPPSTQQTQKVDAPSVRVGDRWITEIVDHQDARLNYRSERVVLEARDDRIVTSVRTIGKDYTRVVEYDGQWGLLATRLPSGAATKYSPALPYFSFPAYPGKSWRARVLETGDDGLQRVHEIRATIGEWGSVSVPAGSFKALKIVLADDITKNGVLVQQGQDVSWYAPELRRTVKTEETSLNPSTGERRRRTISLTEYSLAGDRQPAQPAATSAAYRRVDVKPKGPGGTPELNRGPICEADPRAYFVNRLTEARSVAARGGRCAEAWMDDYRRLASQFRDLDGYWGPQDESWCSLAASIPLEVWKDQLAMCR